MLRAAIAVAAIRAGMLFVSFRNLERFTRPRNSFTSSPIALDRAQIVVWTINAAANRIPGANCLCRALAARWLMGREGISATLRLGAAKEGNQFRAHAWLATSSGSIVFGESETRFTPFPEIQTDSL
ncbi:MAG TPA: lasso peptide biosynthesis B2 protein [Candidatus Acidoferrales bacterium]|nr:lasso peptide biosynthesis B2 protein [Candidatus Acidoferrales bacterium]